MACGVTVCRRDLTRKRRLPRVSVRDTLPQSEGRGPAGERDLMQHGTVALRTLPGETKRQQRSKPQSPYEHIFDGYNAAGGSYAEAFDEMFDAQGNVRGPYKGIYRALAPSDSADLDDRAEALRRAFVDQGITFSLSGQE